MEQLGVTCFEDRLATVVFIVFSIYIKNLSGEKSNITISSFSYISLYTGVHFYFSDS